VESPYGDGRNGNDWRNGNDAVRRNDATNERHDANAVRRHDAPNGRHVSPDELAHGRNDEPAYGPPNDAMANDGKEHDGYRHAVGRFGPDDQHDESDARAGGLHETMHELLRLVQRRQC